MRALLARRKRHGAATPDATTTGPSGRELASRESDGLQIVLFWHPRQNEVTVSVADSHTGNRFEFLVDRARALDAFHHPFAYSP